MYLENGAESYTGADGRVDLKYNFNQNDNKLTGTVEVHREILKIDSGQINGTILKFNITDDQGVRILHFGTLVGDLIYMNLNYVGMEYNVTLNRFISVVKTKRAEQNLGHIGTASTRTVHITSEIKTFGILFRKDYLINSHLPQLTD